MFEWNDGSYLAHYGIIGQKWGIRRFQNEDGSLTPAGRERYGVGSKKENTSHDSNKQTGSTKWGVYGLERMLHTPEQNYDNNDDVGPSGFAGRYFVIKNGYIRPRLDSSGDAARDLMDGDQAETIRDIYYAYKRGRFDLDTLISKVESVSYDAGIDYLDALLSRDGDDSLREYNERP